MRVPPAAATSLIYSNVTPAMTKMGIRGFLLFKSIVRVMVFPVSCISDNKNVEFQMRPGYYFWVMSESQPKQERLQTHLSRVLQEQQEAAQGRLTRQQLIRQIEARDPQTSRPLLLYVANIEHPATG